MLCYVYFTTIKELGTEKKKSATMAGIGKAFRTPQGTDPLKEWYAPPRSRTLRWWAASSISLHLGSLIHKSRITIRATCLGCGAD